MRNQLHYILKILTVFVLGGFYILAPYQAAALNETQRFEIERRPYYDPTDCAPGSGGGAVGSSSSTSTSGGGSATGKIYMIGDSITNGTKTQLDAAFKAKGFSNVVIDGVDSRRLSSGGDTKDGISVFEKSKDQWKDANVIVIALGTNGTINTPNIQSIMKTAKAGNSGAKVYWVNLGAVGRPEITSTNSTIQQLSSSEGYTVIDWAKVIQEHPDYISDLGVHPFTAAGRPAFANTVADGVANGGSGSASSSSSGGGCGCSVGTTSTGSTDLSGNDNAEKIWKYLVGNGFSPVQAAGIMGNMQAESHFEPRLVQYGQVNSRGEVSQAGKPSSLDDNVPTGPQAGYGIVQWTPATKILPYAKPPGDLGQQLKLLVDQLNGQTGIATKAAGDALKTATTVEEATTIFEQKYEIHAGPAQQSRIDFAKSVLAQFGSTAGDAGSVSSGSSGSENCSSTAPTTDGAKDIPGTRADWLKLIKDSNNFAATAKYPGKVDADLADATNGAQDGLVKLLAQITTQYKKPIKVELIKHDQAPCGDFTKDAQNYGPYTSSHWYGLAADITGTSPEIDDLYKWLYTNRAVLNLGELEHSPVPEGTKGIKFGGDYDYPPAIQADHKDHIHVAVKGTGPVGAGCTPKPGGEVIK